MRVAKQVAQSLFAAALVLCVLVPLSAPAQTPESDDGKLRIIVFGAHPDDCELKAGGVAALWSQLGHHVKFVSTTNGDIGHAVMSGGQLAVRRTREVEAAARVLGIETHVMDNHDGELLPTLENRREIVRLIRDWRADIVMGHRPNDYHPDHRYTGVLMQDAAYMVTVRHFCPDTPHLNRNPVFLYLSDRFQKPNPFQPDVVVSIDKVLRKKNDALWTLESQIESLWATGGFETIDPLPSDPEALAVRRSAFDKKMFDRFEREATRFRSNLIDAYGEEIGSRVETAEAFELCEYGRQPSEEELKQFFPFFD